MTRFWEKTLAVQPVEIVLLAIDIQDVAQHQIAICEIVRDTSHRRKRSRSVVSKFEAAFLHREAETIPESLAQFTTNA